MDKNTFNLTRAMATLYKTMDYYVSLPPRAHQEPDTYWSPTTDPDGHSRNRLNEEESRGYLANIRQELKFIEGLKPGKILDIGCGPGWLLSAVDPAWEKYGIEPSRTAGAIAAAHAHIEIGNFEDAVSDNKAFDLIVMYHVIEHMQNPVDALKSVHSMLYPKGHLILGTPDFDSGAARRYEANYRLLHDPTHISLFSNDSMHRLLRDIGFKIEKVEYPFFDTSYFTRKSLLRLLSPHGISPPFYGNFMTFYCTV
jgi:SAM-dependent methyltransferase